MNKSINDLTFAELRLANMVHPHTSTKALLIKPGLDLLKKLDDATLAVALAELVIQIDWLAADRSIDLVLALRNCFASEVITGDSPDSPDSPQTPWEGTRA